jgi:hypothetical protein
MGYNYLKEKIKVYKFLEDRKFLSFFFNLFYIYHKFHRDFKLDEKTYI